MKTRLEPIFLICYVVAILLGIVACNDNIDIKKDYPFSIETMPVQSGISEGETAEIRCALKREDVYTGTEYTIRYFQSEGKGILRLDDGTTLTANDRFKLRSDTFRLYYTSACGDGQTIDIWIEDNFGNTATMSFTFNNTDNKE